KAAAEAGNADKISGCSVGAEYTPAPETRRSTKSGVRVCINCCSNYYSPGTCGDIGEPARRGTNEGQSGQVNGSASCRHNVGTHLLQRYGVSLGRLDGDERPRDEKHQ